MKKTEQNILNSTKMKVQEVVNIERCRPYHMEKEFQDGDEESDNVEVAQKRGDS